MASSVATGVKPPQGTLSCSLGERGFVMCGTGEMDGGRITCPERNASRTRQKLFLADAGMCFVYGTTGASDGRYRVEECSVEPVTPHGGIFRKMNRRFYLCVLTFATLHSSFSFALTLPCMRMPSRACHGYLIRGVVHIGRTRKRRAIFLSPPRLSRPGLPLSLFSFLSLHMTPQPVTGFAAFHGALNVAPHR